jgi:cytochrome c oxidase assembly protein subunit 15
VLHRRRLRVSPRAVRILALVAVAAYAVLIVTGGAVRLTGSGLGCPDWPSCYQHRLTAAVSLHPMVEFLNRMVTVVVSVISIVACAGVWLRSPRRRDLSWPAAGLIIGLVAQIVLGGLVVIFKLNPYLVALHFVLTLVVLADAVILYHRAGIPDEDSPAPYRWVVARDLRLLTGVLVTTLGVITTVGTVVTGSGPHAGGKGAKRIPVTFHSVAELHSSLGWLLLGLAGASVIAFAHAQVPEVVKVRVRTLFELVVLQGSLGYTQYFLHDSPVVVGFHLAGVTALWIAAITLVLSLHSHGAAPAEADSAGLPAPLAP